MSEPENDPAVDPQGDSGPSNDASDRPAPTRSSTERLLVWGGIGLLLVLVAFQGHARVGYQMTLKEVEARLQQDDGPDPRPLMLNEVDALIVGWPSRRTIEETEHRNALNLSWRGLASTYEINLQYDPAEPAIYEVYTKDAPEFVAPMAASEEVTPTGPAADPTVMAGPDGLVPIDSVVEPPPPTETGDTESEESDTPDASSENEEQTDEEQTDEEQTDEEQTDEEQTDEEQ